MAEPDPADIFPTSYNTGMLLCEKVDITAPDQSQLDKEDGEKLLLYVSTSVVNALHIISGALQQEITDPLEVDGVNLTAAARRTRLNQQLQRPIIALSQVSHMCAQQAKRYDGYYIDENLTPITPPKVFGPTDNVETVSDQSLRNAGVFDGNQSSCPEALQAFLVNLNDIGRTNKLSEPCMVKLVQRRCLLTARTLVDNFLASLPDINAPGTLTKLILFMEKVFSLAWRPSSCKASLALLPQKYKNTKNYVQLQARILQLSHLASLGEKDEDRPAFMKANQLPVFQACLNREDQDILLRLETQRKSQSLPSLNLAAAVDHLQQHHAARQLAHNDSSKDSMLPQASEQAMWAQDSRQPRRQRRSDSAPAPRAHPDNRQRSVSRQPRTPRNSQPNNNNNNNNNNSNNNARRVPLWEKYGVPRNHCLQCSSPHHRVNDPKCPYSNTGLPENACRYPNCSTPGAHWSYLCKTRLQANANKQQQGQQQQQQQQQQPQQQQQSYRSQPSNSQPRGQSSRGRSRLSRGRSFRGGKSPAARRLMDTAHQAAEDLTGEGDGFFLDE